MVVLDSACCIWVSAGLSEPIGRRSLDFSEVRHRTRLHLPLSSQCERYCKVELSLSNPESPPGPSFYFADQEPVQDSSISHSEYNFSLMMIESSL